MIPNPGSDEARKLGCRCPVLDNNAVDDVAWDEIAVCGRFPGWSIVYAGPSKFMPWSWRDVSSMLQDGLVWVCGTDEGF